MAGGGDSGGRVSRTAASKTTVRQTPPTVMTIFRHWAVYLIWSQAHMRDIDMCSPPLDVHDDQPHGLPTKPVSMVRLRDTGQSSRLRNELTEVGGGSFFWTFSRKIRAAFMHRKAPGRRLPCRGIHSASSGRVMSPWCCAWRGQPGRFLWRHCKHVTASDTALWFSGTAPPLACTNCISAYSLHIYCPLVVILHCCGGGVWVSSLCLWSESHCFRNHGCQSDVTTGP